MSRYSKMKYGDDEKQQTDSAGPKKKLTREDFRKDVANAVKKGIDSANPKSTKSGKKGGKRGSTKQSYDSMKVSELRAFLNQKKLALLKKSGFPEGKLPRSKVAMIALCKKLKRKRW